MKTKILNVSFNPVYLCQSDNFSSEIQESINLQQLAACEFLYKALCKNPDAFIQVQGNNGTENERRSKVLFGEEFTNDCIEGEMLNKNEGMEILK